MLHVYRRPLLSVLRPDLSDDDPKILDWLEHARKNAKEPRSLCGLSCTVLDELDRYDGALPASRHRGRMPAADD